MKKAIVTFQRPFNGDKADAVKATVAQTLGIAVENVVALPDGVSVLLVDAPEPTHATKKKDSEK